MPNHTGIGPYRDGPMAGRGFGPCGGAQVNGPKRGTGRGFGRGMGRVFGPQFGWFGVGYGSESEAIELRAQSLRASLEQRAAYLRAELARIESFLKDLPEGSESEGTQST
jgi:hypothetical protein